MTTFKQLNKHRDDWDRRLFDEEWGLKEQVFTNGWLTVGLLDQLDENCTMALNLSLGLPPSAPAEETLSKFPKKSSRTLYRSYITLVRVRLMFRKQHGVLLVEMTVPIHGRPTVINRPPLCRLHLQRETRR
jgi:hypothetical protein